MWITPGWTQCITWFNKSIDERGKMYRKSIYPFLTFLKENVIRSHTPNVPFRIPRCTKGQKGLLGHPKAHAIYIYWRNHISLASSAPWVGTFPACYVCSTWEGERTASQRRESGLVIQFLLIFTFLWMLFHILWVCRTREKESYCCIWICIQRKFTCPRYGNFMYMVSRGAVCIFVSEFVT